jgi:hypothetical protein
MDNHATAQEIVHRLNTMIEDDERGPQLGVRDLLHRMCETRLPVSPELAAEHSTIQAGPNSTVGLLGVLNGICGAWSDGYGLIAGVFDEDGKLVRFVMTRYESTSLVV